MKNLHLVATDKPSRLCIDNSCNELNYSQIEGLSSKHITNQHIYITSDEKIKEGDWYFDGTDLIHKKTKYNDALVDGNKNAKKIILTTEQDLIQDGVQAIDDDFLEWFVKNPSCEEVKTNLVAVNDFGSEVLVTSYGFDRFIYKIIIPKQEAKQKKLYTEEEVIAIVEKSRKTGLTAEYLIEQLKK